MELHSGEGRQLSSKPPSIQLRPVPPQKRVPSTPFLTMRAGGVGGLGWWRCLASEPQPSLDGGLSLVLVLFVRRKRLSSVPTLLLVLPMQQLRPLPDQKKDRLQRRHPHTHTSTQPGREGERLARLPSFPPLLACLHGWKEGRRGGKGREEPILHKAIDYVRAFHPERERESKAAVVWSLPEAEERGRRRPSRRRRRRKSEARMKTTEKLWHSM